ncbi:hypothetical protein C5167_010130 [Papaver somniferum]|uniref:Uncharacterized protein n=1 Tax=Papaver somniferum TaxID=3469 RepID=A0A4Y7K387_PAPSO|nr:hypothetical protein C5167_010130 [Papaver somniferum]
MAIGTDNTQSPLVDPAAQKRDNPSIRLLVCGLGSANYSGGIPHWLGCVRIGGKSRLHHSFFEKHVGGRSISEAERNLLSYPVVVMHLQGDNAVDTAICIANDVNLRGI